MKTINLIKDLILEASKKDVLIQKLGFNEKNAELLFTLAGPLSVWLGNKLIDHIIVTEWGGAEPLTREEALDILNRDRIISRWRNDIVSIMDWIRVGLNGNAKTLKDDNLGLLYQKSKDWHESLNIGSGEINYIEKNPLLRDYRKDGIGFYWTDLKTNTSDEECDRMGHCGRTSSNNTIYSLRETKRINEQYTINKSHLTAAVGNSDGIIYQMKGAKNSKPKEEFHPYIVDLIINDETIQGFGSEYQRENDFKITDLSQDDIRKVYESRPELFDTRKLKRKLIELGILDPSEYEEIDMIFNLKISADDVGDYVDGDWTVRSYKNKNGNTVKVSFIETLLSGDFFDLIEGYHEDWEGGLEYHTNEENSNTIREIIKKRAGDDYDPEESLENLINEYDDDYEIRSSLGGAYEQTANDSYYNYAMEELRSALEEYGDVTQLNDEGAEIQIDLRTVIDNMELGEEEVDEIFERCDDSAECAFSEMMGEYYDKPKFRLDDRWSPSINDNDFNSTLSERLSEI